MKILMVHPHDIYSPLEPWTIRIVKLACALAENGHEVTLAHFPFSAGGAKKAGSVHIVSLERNVSAGVFIYNINTLCKLAQSVDVVHFQKSQFYAALPAVIAAFLTGKHLHYDWDDWEEKIFCRSIELRGVSTCLTTASFYLLERLLPLLADSMSVASEALKALAIQRGANKYKITLVPVGGDLQQFHPDQDGMWVRRKYNLTTELLVFYHGQLHSCQYVNMFLKAIRIMIETKRNGSLKFMVAGSGSELVRLKESARELGVREHVIFTDFVPHAQIPDYIAAADICVSPFEDNEVTRCKSPLKIVEYLASGKPVVASDVGEVSHMLSGGVGLLVPPGFPEEIAGGVLKLAENEVLRKTMSEAARKRAEEKYNWRVSVLALEGVYAIIK